MSQTLEARNAIEQNAWHNKMIEGDCLGVLRGMPSDIVDLIVTSPPYADSRKNSYGGIHPDNYALLR